MISPKKLIKIARKWQKLAALKRKRIPFPGVHCSSAADKGHFVVYTADQKRHVFRISYLNNQIFQELLKISEEEFCLPSNAPKTLPFDSVFMEYALLFIKKCVDKNIKEALLTSIASIICSSSHNSVLDDRINNQQLIICSC